MRSAEGTLTATYRRSVLLRRQPRDGQEGSAGSHAKALDRLLYRIRHANPAYGPTYASKIDISDGFYRIPLDGNTAPNLSVMLPALPGEPSLVGIPLALPMGWVESPPIFCSFTETIADLANHRYHRRHAPPHRLDAIADTPTKTTYNYLPPVYPGLAQSRASLQFQKSG